MGWQGCISFGISRGGSFLAISSVYLTHGLFLYLQNLQQNSIFKSLSDSYLPLIRTLVITLAHPEILDNLFMSRFLT